MVVWVFHCNISVLKSWYCQQSLVWGWIPDGRHGNKKNNYKRTKCFCRCICCTVSKSVWTVVPWQGAASTQPLVLYVAPENILRPLEENWKCHTRDVSLLWGGHLVAEGELQQRLKTHFGKLLPHPHIDLCLCWKTSILHCQHLADVTLLSDLQHNECTQGVLLSCSKYEAFDRSHCCWWTTGSAFATMPGYSEISPTILTSSWPPCCLINGITDKTELPSYLWMTETGSGWNLYSA